ADRELRLLLLADLPARDLFGRDPRGHRVDRGARSVRPRGGRGVHAVLRVRPFDAHVGGTEAALQLLEQVGLLDHRGPPLAPTPADRPTPLIHAPDAARVSASRAPGS